MSCRAVSCRASHYALSVLLLLSQPSIVRLALCIVSITIIIITILIIRIITIIIIIIIIIIAAPGAEGARAGLPPALRDGPAAARALLR